MIVSRRTERIGEQLRAEIARILREEAADPRIRLVTLTRVDVSPDLARADVLWSTMDSADPAIHESVERGLESAAGFVRRRLARDLSLRRTPEIHFRHDPSFELGGQTLALLQSLRDDTLE
ncbi:MAG: 30S ribosome-binding factor RbfA [Deltaproteobacteria bacterium]|nr:MAG: 30S ribosome-binding factor RbfA [Deltaproteobacteria bacterium]